MGVIKEAGRLGETTRRVAGDFGSNLIKSGSAAATERSILGHVGHALVVRPLGWAVKVAELPLTMAMKATRWTVGGVGGVVSRHPRAALVVGGVAAVGAVGSAMQHRKEAQSSQYYQQQAANLQQGPAYMNSVSPAESAQMEAMMKQGGQGGSFADAAQQRTAAANAPSV